MTPRHDDRRTHSCSTFDSLFVRLMLQAAADASSERATFHLDHVCGRCTRDILFRSITLAADASSPPRSV